jgi:hypothetical protein
MRGYDHPTRHAIGSHRDRGAIVEGALHLTFGALLGLIGGEGQPRLKQRMIEQVIVFAARHKREASHIGEHGSIAILPIQPQKSAFLGYGRDCFLGKPFETVSSQMPLF